MDKQDFNMEQQVWQRVRASREEGTRQDLRQMQQEAMELAAVYRGWQDNFPERSGSRYWNCTKGRRKMQLHWPGSGYSPGSRGNP